MNLIHGHVNHIDRIITIDSTKEIFLILILNQWIILTSLQAASHANHFLLLATVKVFKDTRGNHFFRMLDFVDSMRPAIAFFENVKNLVGHDKGKTFKVIKKELKARNYGFHAKVLNTKDYGNIPHNRERIFIVSFDLNKYSKANDRFAFPSPTQLTSSISQIIEKQGG